MASWGSVSSKPPLENFVKIHDSLVERITSLAETYGGHRDEWRLKEELKRLNVAVYTRSSGEQVLVDKNELDKHTQKR